MLLSVALRLVHLLLHHLHRHHHRHHHMCIRRILRHHMCILHHRVLFQHLCITKVSVDSMWSNSWNSHLFSYCVLRYVTLVVFTLNCSCLTSGTKFSIVFISRSENVSSNSLAEIARSFHRDLYYIGCYILVWFSRPTQAWIIDQPFDVKKKKSSCLTTYFLLIFL